MSGVTVTVGHADEALDQRLSEELDRFNASAVSERLYRLFTRDMHRPAEAPTAVFDRIGQHNDFSWLVRQDRGDA